MQRPDPGNGVTPGQLIRWFAAGLFLLGTLSLSSKHGLGLAGLLFGLIFLAITGSLVHFLAKGVDALVHQRRREADENEARKRLCQERGWVFRPIPGRNLRWRVQPGDKTQGWYLDFHLRGGVLPGQDVHQLGFSLQQSGSFPPLLLLHRQAVEPLSRGSSLPVVQVDRLTRFSGTGAAQAQITELARQRPEAGPEGYVWLSLEPGLGRRLGQDTRLNDRLQQLDADLEPIYARARANSSGLFLYAGAEGLEFNGLTVFMSAEMITLAIDILERLKTHGSGPHAMG